MGKKIIVAGGGHGGIAAAKLLSEKGFDVCVCEKNSQDNMGYDWTDIFDPKALLKIGLDMPAQDKFEYKTDMTFYSPNEKKPIRQKVPQNRLEIKMERRDIYDMLISSAKKAGTRFVFDCEVQGAIEEKGKVKGIKTSKGDFYGDLVIDACGCESPLRKSLPDAFGIEKMPKMFEKFYIYRAFFSKAIEGEAEDAYKVCLLPEGKLGIGWVATEEKYTDLLIGRFEEFDLAEANRTADFFRLKNPSLGKNVLRGGSFARIPVRQPISVMVADGYCLIGDSAFMTVPIIGSGIANSFRAAHILADVITENKDKDYTAEVLWDYQKKFYKELGFGLAPLAAVKLLLTKLTPDCLDYIFEKNILTWREMTITADTTSLWDMVKPSFDMPARGVAIVKNKELFKLIRGVAADIAKLLVIFAQMPKEYHRTKVLKWAKKYEGIFE